MTKLGYFLLIIVALGLSFLWTPMLLNPRDSLGGLVLLIPVTFFIIIGVAYSLQLFKKKND